MRKSKNKCSDCGKSRKCMIFDWLTRNWFCARCFRVYLSDIRKANIAHKSTGRKGKAL